MGARKWTTASGEKIYPKDMSDTHLLNCIKLIERKCSEVRTKEIHQVSQIVDMMVGEIASEDGERFLQDLYMSKDEDFYPAIYEDLLKEKERRNLK